MTEVLVAPPQQTRAALCRCCGRPTNFEVEVGALTSGYRGAVYCEGCGDLPRPWYYDGEDVHVESRWNLVDEPPSGYHPLGTTPHTPVPEGLIATPAPMPDVRIIPDVHPPTGQTPTCEACGDTSFRAYVQEQTSGWQRGYGPIAQQDEDCEGTVYIEGYIETGMVDYSEITDADDSEVLHIECAGCGETWTGEWEYC